MQNSGINHARNARYRTVKILWIVNTVDLVCLVYLVENVETVWIV